MHISVLIEVHSRLLPSLTKVRDTFHSLSERFKKVLKIGRTHMQDATPISVGQEFSAFTRQIERGLENVNHGCSGLKQLAIGGTAVGTGVNSFKGFDQLVCDELTKTLKFGVAPAANKFEALSTHDALVSFSGDLNTLATSLFKIANDLRLLGSGPRCGLGELVLPANEPGSSIMPGTNIHIIICKARSIPHNARRFPWCASRYRPTRSPSPWAAAMDISR